jgi:hypothetical protein
MERRLSCCHLGVSANLNAGSMQHAAHCLKLLFSGACGAVQLASKRDVQLLRTPSLAAIVPGQDNLHLIPAAWLVLVLRAPVPLPPLLNALPPQSLILGLQLNKRKESSVLHAAGVPHAAHLCLQKETPATGRCRALQGCM